MAVIGLPGLAAPDPRPLTVAAAFQRACEAALTDAPVGLVGLELETLLVDLDRPAATVGWDRAGPLTGWAGPAARASTITLEPGGQVELSSRPAAGISPAIEQLATDLTAVRELLGQRRLGLACAGADPLRPPRRVNPRARYQAMEDHFTATGRLAPGQVMMNSTAALQLNLQAGPRAGWASRIALAHQIGPVMVALSANSPWLAGHDTGWKSARQRAWSGLDVRCCGPVPGCLAPAAGLESQAATDPSAAWARYALRAPVMFVASGSGAVPVRTAVPFAQWASGRVRLAGRPPAAADLDLHLTTLFPPVRLRGYLELRYLDASPPRWWPAIAATVATLLDDPVAADLAAEATEPVTGRWAAAARSGLADPGLARAARRCLAIAAGQVPAGLAGPVADLASLIDSGRCPGDLLAERIGQIGPTEAFEELAHA